MFRFGTVVFLLLSGLTFLMAAGFYFHESEVGLRNRVINEVIKYQSHRPGGSVVSSVDTAEKIDSVPLDGTISIESESLDAVLFEGTADKQLDRGVGHYLNTALPGQEGNFAVAAHRGLVPDIDKMGAGDEIVIINQGVEYTYEWRESFVVPPDAVEVLNPIDGYWLTLTTCHPRYSNEQRLIVRAELTSPAT